LGETQSIGTPGVKLVSQDDQRFGHRQWFWYVQSRFRR